MEITINIHDDLLNRAKRHAKATGCSLRKVVEEGLPQVLTEPAPTVPYKLPDLRVGDPNGDDPLKHYTWPKLRDLIYEGRGA